MLAVALTKLEDETGPEGFPLDEEMDSRTNGEWEAVVVTNEAVATREQYMKTKGKDLEPGQRVVVRRRPPNT